jgi:hypothetical protein
MRAVSSGAKTRAEAETAWPWLTFVDPPTSDAKNAAAKVGLMIKTVLDYYYEKHASKLPSAQQARIAKAHLEAHFEDAAVATLADEEVQQAYVRERNLDGVGERTIDRELSVLRAALRRYAEKHADAPCPRIYHVALPETFAT